MSSAPTTQAPSRDERFITHLGELATRKDRGALAALRRAVGRTPAEATEAHRYIQRWLGDEPTAGDEYRYYLVAGLFAHHYEVRWSSERQGYTNLGASFRVLAGKAGSEEAVERRFVALLNAHPEDLDKHLRHAVSLLKAHEIPVDWLRLLGDLRGWGNPERYVQRNWARAFWGGRQDADTTEAQAGPSESGNDD